MYFVICLLVPFFVNIQNYSWDCYINYVLFIFLFIRIYIFIPTPECVFFFLLFVMVSQSLLYVIACIVWVCPCVCVLIYFHGQVNLAHTEKFSKPVCVFLNCVHCVLLLLSTCIKVFSRRVLKTAIIPPFAQKCKTDNDERHRQ